GRDRDSHGRVGRRGPRQSELVVVRGAALDDARRVVRLRQNQAGDLVVVDLDLDADDGQAVVPANFVVTGYGGIPLPIERERVGGVGDDQPHLAGGGAFGDYHRRPTQTVREAVGVIGERGGAFCQAGGATQGVAARYRVSDRREADPLD